MGPLIYISSMEKYPLSIGLHFFRSQATPSARPLWNLTMAASVIAMLPPLMLFFFAQRYYIQGVVVSGIKG
jgi:multiple sugar transport system permease protein